MSRYYMVGAENYRAQVVTQTDPLALREAPVNGSVLTWMPRGAIVDVAIGPSPKAGWSYVTYNGKTGYASDAYLKRFDGGSPPLPVVPSSSNDAPSSANALVAPKLSLSFLFNKSTGLALGGIAAVGLLYYWAKRKARGY